MQDLDEFTATDAALEQMAATPNTRLKEICDAAVRHMHAFAREVNLTPEEWLFGIQFLTEVGKACTPVRQEFILLSDVLGLSAVVNALHDKKARELGSQSSLLGPFYREGAPEMPLGACIAAHPTAEVIAVYGQVTGNDGKPIPNALIQVWQTSEHGLYDLQTHGLDGTDLRANFRTDAQGRYHFRTVRPLGYSIPDGWPGRRDGEGAEPARLPAVAHPFPDRRRGLPRIGHRAVFRRRRAYRFGHGVRRVRFAGGERGGGSELAGSGPACGALRFPPGRGGAG